MENPNICKEVKRSLSQNEWHVAVSGQLMVIVGE